MQYPVALQTHNFSTAPASPQPAPLENEAKVTKITNCKILRDHQIVEHDAIWIQGDKIIDPHKFFWYQKRLPDLVLDAGGLLVVPGFIEVQINGTEIGKTKKGCRNTQSTSLLLVRLFNHPDSWLMGRHSDHLYFLQLFPTLCLSSPSPHHSFTPCLHAPLPPSPLFLAAVESHSYYSILLLYFTFRLPCCSVVVFRRT